MQVFQYQSQSKVKQDQGMVWERKPSQTHSGRCDIHSLQLPEFHDEKDAQVIPGFFCFLQVKLPRSLKLPHQIPS